MLCDPTRLGFLAGLLGVMTRRKTNPECVIECLPCEAGGTMEERRPLPATSGEGAAPLALPPSHPASQINPHTLWVLAMVSKACGADSEWRVSTVPLTDL